MTNWLRTVRAVVTIVVPVAIFASLLYGAGVEPVRALSVASLAVTGLSCPVVALALAAGLAATAAPQIEVVQALHKSWMAEVDAKIAAAKLGGGR